MAGTKWIKVTQPGESGGVPMLVRPSSVQAIVYKPINPLGQGADLILIGGSIRVLETVDAIVQAIAEAEEGS
jgi:hypothetical protein